MDANRKESRKLHEAASTGLIGDIVKDMIFYGGLFRVGRRSVDGHSAVDRLEGETVEVKFAIEADILKRRKRFANVR